jgi:hypothetical protein
MARGERSEHNEARIVDMKQWKMRNHPASGGSGMKPPKKPNTTTGGNKEPYDSNDDHANPYGMPRPNTDWFKD